VLWQTEVAASRTIGSANIAGRGVDTGADAGFPTIQGRTSLKFPFILGKPTTIGVSGHWGEEEHELNDFGYDRHFKTWSGNMDADIGIADWLSLKGEAYVGENLEAYLGGIGQGVDRVLRREIGSHGGWAALSFKPGQKKGWDKWKNWVFNSGYGVDGVDHGDLSSDAARTSNRVTFVNAIYSITKAASVGLEVSRLETDYKGGRDGETYRAQLAFMYEF
jgi:hypothetical protein